MPKRLKMQDLERLTGVGREAIRFYIREGLLPEPERPARNVAYYDESFVERIRFVRELREKRYLPLHVIKSIVTTSEAPPRAEIDALLALNGRLFPQVTGPEVEREALRDVARRARITVKEIRELAAIEALDIAEEDDVEWLDADGVRLIDLWAELRRSGFTREMGFTPEQCRFYVDGMRWLARQELRLFTRHVTGKRAAAAAALMAEKGIDLGNQMVGILRRRALLRYIARGNVPDEATIEAEAPRRASLPRRSRRRPR